MCTLCPPENLRSNQEKDIYTSHGHFQTNLTLQAKLSHILHEWWLSWEWATTNIRRRFLAETPRYLRRLSLDQATKHSKRQKAIVRKDSIEWKTQLNPRTNRTQELQLNQFSKPIGSNMNVRHVCTLSPRKIIGSHREKEHTHESWRTFPTKLTLWAKQSHIRHHRWFSWEWATTS